MEFRHVEWHRVDQRCPCACGNEGVLIFIACLQCRTVMLLCDEVGTVFPQLRSPQEKPWLSWHDHDVCPQCQGSELSSFDYATSDQIRAAGFELGEYA